MLPGKSTIDTYGGIRVDAETMVDPTSEVNAASFNELASDVANLTRTAPIIEFQFTGSATTPTITNTATWALGWDSVFGTDNVNKPVLARTGTGIITVTFPAAITDALGNNQYVNIRAIEGKAAGATLYHLQGTVNSSTTATLYLFNSSAAANDAAGVLFFVRVY